MRRGLLLAVCTPAMVVLMVMADVLPAAAVVGGGGAVLGLVTFLPGIKAAPQSIRYRFLRVEFTGGFTGRTALGKTMTCGGTFLVLALNVTGLGETLTGGSGSVNTPLTRANFASKNLNLPAPCIGTLFGTFERVAMQVVLTLNGRIGTCGGCIAGYPSGFTVTMTITLRPTQTLGMAGLAAYSIKKASFTKGVLLARSAA